MLSSFSASPLAFDSQENGPLLREIYLTCLESWGHAVAQLAEALRYKSEGRGFDSL